MIKKDFLSITDLKNDEIMSIIQKAISLKKEIKKFGKNQLLLKSKTLVMLFQKPSLRTRLSFETGMTQLGGHAVYLSPNDIGLNIREPVYDIAAVSGSMGDIIMFRTFDHHTVEELAHHSRVPVINGLSDREHPCQILADLLTIYENKGALAGLKIAFIGDGENNVTHSLILACALLGINCTIASPKGYFTNSYILKKAQIIAMKNKCTIAQVFNPKMAAVNADVIYTDTWVSMGDEKEKEQRLKDFSSYTVSRELMSLAQKDAIFMHDMPAYRGCEVTAEVINGPQSVIYQQAENRLHAQKALLVYLLKEKYSMMDITYSHVV